MHSRRAAYYVVGDEEIVGETPLPRGGAPDRVPPIRFGRLFGRTQHAYRPDEVDAVVRKLVRLGLLMNESGKKKGDSDIPAGYTYLGQFIAHEVTHDSTGSLLVADLRPENLSTPAVDLDSLYGGEDGPKKRPELYESDGVRLRTYDTFIHPGFTKDYPNDLPRRGTEVGPEGEVRVSAEPLLADPRNAENLALAQTHVAFIHFHNKVAADLEGRHPAGHYTADKLFEEARAEVVRHYQWVILYDFLPQLVRADVLDCVMRHGRRWFKGGDELFMPLEFSAAAFRIGHTMVRAAYEWNPRRRTGSGHEPAPELMDLFKQTGLLEGGHKRLTGDWVIDWRHFFDFGPLGRYLPATLNLSAKLDTVFDMHLDKVTGAPSEQLDQMQKAITVRNLLRGFYLGLTTGEEAAEWMGETPLTRKELADGPLEGLLDDRTFWGKTPLWYYVLKEAELEGYNRKGRPGNRLGPVGSRIVAETLVGLIEHSRYSILREKKWRPAYARPGSQTAKRPTFEMIDLLHFAGVVSPVAESEGQLFVT
jgi:hypothetical protein